MSRVCLYHLIIDEREEALAAKPRVHEIASELGVSTKVALAHLKSMGEFVKGPSSSIQPPVARRLRNALRALGDSQIDQTQLIPTLRTISRRDESSSHPEAIASARRREVVQRSETDWAKFGISEADRDEWLRTGIPADRAHIAAMCLDSIRRNVPKIALSPENLKRRVSGSSETALDSLLGGANSVRVQAKLAASLGMQLEGVNQGLVAVTALSATNAVDLARPVKQRLERIQFSAQMVPEIADITGALIRIARPVIEANRDLRLQTARYRDDRVVGPLLAAFARVHGVFHVDDNLDRLIDGVTREAADYEELLQTGEVYSVGASSRRFFFMKVEASEAMGDFLNGSGGLSISDEPFQPSGFGVLQLPGDSPENPSTRIVSWRSVDGSLRAVARRRATLQLGFPSAFPHFPNEVEIWRPGSGEIEERTRRFESLGCWRHCRRPGSRLRAEARALGRLQTLRTTRPPPSLDQGKGRPD